MIQYTQQDIDTISKIYEVATDPNHWDEALEYVAKQADADGTVLFVEDSKNSGLSLLSSNTFFSQQELQHYVQNVLPLEADGYTLIPNLSPRELHLDTEFQSEEAADNMAGLRWSNKLHGVQCRAVTYLHDKGIWFDAFTCQYKIPRSEFTDEHRQKMNLFLPHIAKVVELNRPFTQLKKRYQAVLAALDFLHLGVFILEPNQEVVIHNSEADRILSLKDGIQINAGKRLVLNNDDENRKLSHAINEMFIQSNAKKKAAEFLMTAKRPSLADAYILEVCPIYLNQAEYDEEIHGVFVLVVDPEHTQVVSTHGLQEIYQLTSAEAEVCRLLAEGKESKDIADIRNVSLVTVKSQIKKLFEKTGVRQRSQLVRLALAVNLPIQDSSE